MTMPEGKPAQSTGTASRLLNDRYEIGERLADGTFFFVHRGHDHQTGRAVAVKVLKPEYAADEAFAGRLLAEAQAAVRLQHPNIARVYDAWRERGTVVLVTELVPGIHLKDRIRRVAPFPLAVAVDILLACAQALHYAHENGFVHGDLRPEHIVITRDGRVKLTDFGIGTAVAASQRIQLHALASAVDYLAPEVAQGQAPDVQTDLYALGCILYEMLTGSPPFEADTPLAAAARHLHEPPPALRKANPSVPPAVEGIALKCMQKEPVARYLTAAGLLHDVHAVREALRNDQPLDWSPMGRTGGETAVGGRKRGRAEGARRAAATGGAESDSGPSSRLLVGVALLALAMIVLFFGVVAFMIRPPGQVAVPATLERMPEAAAVAALERLGLKAQIRREYHDRVPAGHVFEVSPPAGTELRQGKSVMLFVSQGPQPVRVPDLVGRTREAALQELRAAGLVAGETKEEFSDVIPRGEVMAQSPVAGSEAPRQSPVTLTVSKGPEPEPPAVELTPSLPETENAEPSRAPEDGEGTTAELPVRDHVVTLRIPARRGSESARPQRVRIVVRQQDGTEETAYDAEHQPGDVVTHTVTTVGEPGKCQIRVYLNDELIESKPV